MLTNDYPRPFELPDEPVTCPTGRVFGVGTKEALVWHLLHESATRRHRWKIAQTSLHGPAGRVPAPAIAQPYSGGQRGTRCVRELRRQGFKIPHHQGELEIYPGLQSKLTFYWLDLQLVTGEVQSTLFAPADTPMPTAEPSPIQVCPIEPAASGPLTGSTIVFTDAGTPLESLDAYCPPTPIVGEETYRRFLRDVFRRGGFSMLRGRTQRLKVTPATVARVGVDPRPVLMTTLPRLGVSVSVESN